MYKKLIKDYKYIGEESTDNIEYGKVVKTGHYPQPEFDQFDTTIVKAQKKKIETKLKPDTLSSEKNSPQSENKKAVPASADVVQNIPVANNHNIDIESVKQSVRNELKAEFEAMLKTEKNTAYNQGLRDGKKNAIAENSAKCEQVKNIFSLIKEELEKQSEKYFEEISNVAMDMSIHLARKIVGDCVSSNPEIIKTNVDKCVDLLAGSGTVEMKINPADYEIIKTYLPDLEQKFAGKYTFVLEPDQKIDRGGCLVEFEGSMIDGRIETQIEKLKQQMEMIT